MRRRVHAWRCTAQRPSLTRFPTPFNKGIVEMYVPGGRRRPAFTTNAALISRLLFPQKLAAHLHECRSVGSRKDRALLTSFGGCFGRGIHVSRGAFPSFPARRPRGTVSSARSCQDGDLAGLLTSLPALVMRLHHDYLGISHLLRICCLLLSGAKCHVVDLSMPIPIVEPRGPQ
jgi:hypothetical protein